MNFKKYLYTILLVFLFIEVLIVFPAKLEESRKEEEQLKKKLKIDKNAAEQIMGGVHLVESQKGLRDWELFAEKAEGGKESKDWNLRKVKIIFYSDELPQFIVTGAEGTIEGKKRNVRIRGSVVTTSANGYIFKSENVEYQAKLRNLISPVGIEMLAPADKSGDGLKMTGTSMVIEVDKKIMNIMGPVKSYRKLADGKNLEVQAQSAIFSSISNEARFLGEVMMTYDQMHLKGPEASFLYKKASSVLGFIEFKGGVEVSDNEKKAISENVSLDVLLQKYTFKGSPKVQQGEDELQGDEIIFLEGGNKVKVVRARGRMENK